MTDRLRTALTAAISDLEWFKIPHTIDQIIGLYSEALAGRTMRYRHGVSNDEMVASQRASATGAGGMTDPAWSDPTGDAVLRGQPDAIDDSDETLGAIDATLALLEDAARRLDHLGADACGQVRWHPPQAADERQGRLSVVISRLHHAKPRLDAAVRHDEEQSDELVRLHIAEPAAWLPAKGEDIWRASRGDTQPVAIQRAIVECTCCSAWRKGTIAQVRGLCDQCSTFQGHHRCLPTEAIVRRWDWGKGATPAQVLEAKVASRKRRRSAAS